MLSENLQKTFKHSNRSSSRTNVMNEAIVEIIKQKYPNLSFKTEYLVKEDGYNKASFKVDIAVFDNSGNFKMCILIKMPLKTFNKNANNFANTTIGEAARLKFAKNSPDKVIFLNIYPNSCPVLDKEGKIKSWENPKSVKANTERVLKNQYPDGSVKEHTIWYDYVNKNDPFVSGILIKDEQGQVDGFKDIL